MFVVVGCSKCRGLWVTEQRFKRVRCPRCGKGHALASRQVFWKGSDPVKARAFVQGAL